MVANFLLLNHFHGRKGRLRHSQQSLFNDREHPGQFTLSQGQPFTHAPSYQTFNLIPHLGLEKEI